VSTGSVAGGKVPFSGASSVLVQETRAAAAIIIAYMNVLFIAQFLF
jgi:hypothetical protein